MARRVGLALCTAGLVSGCTEATVGSAQTAAPGSSPANQPATTSVAPTPDTQEPDLTSVDPCALGDPGQLQSLGYDSAGDLNRDEPGRPSCVFDGAGASFVSLIASVSPDFPYDYFVAPAANKTVAPVATGPFESVSVVTLELPNSCLVAVRIRAEQVLIAQSNNANNSEARNCEIAVAVATSAASKVA